MKCGLLGEKLGHSYSPQIHAELADYEYKLYEKAPDEVEDFVRRGDWHGLNVTIPYKKTVIPFCDELSETARAIGSVNTLLKRPDGTIFGDNTDAFGFETLLTQTLKADISGWKALVLGTGGASVTVCAMLRKRGAQVVPISRSGKDNYTNLEWHRDAKLLVNTTPVGMYPKNGASLVDLGVFPKLEAVLDVVYNPARTALLLQAEKRGIPCAGGLTMLVAQAKRSAEIFLSHALPDGEIARITRQLARQMQNVILIGMPGSGKSTVGRLLAEKLGRPLLEADKELEKAAGMSIPVIFANEGEAGFRKRETRILSDLGKQSGTVISTGGGCVTREENYPLLHQNGVIVWIRRDLNCLAREGRPLSLNADLSAMYAVRAPLYERFADFAVDNDGNAEDTVNLILEVLQ
jgi:shikimate dehydrogenase